MEKVNVARKLAAQLSEKFGRHILAVLLDGSVARCDDTEYSDMELRVVTRGRIRTERMSDSGFLEFVHKDLAIQVQFVAEREVANLILNPTVEWPLKVCPYVEPVIVMPTAETKKTVRKFRRCYDGLEPDRFRPAIQWSLVWIWEMRGKIVNMIERKSRDVFWCAPAMAHNAALFVALINGRYLHFGDSRYLPEIQSFPLIPKDFTSLFEALQSSDVGKIDRAAKRMWEGCLKLAEDHGYPMKTYRKWSDVEVLLSPPHQARSLSNDGVHQ
jgi:predicted nucleotidyltransferase